MPQKHTAQALPHCPGGKRIKNNDGGFECIYSHQSDRLECPKGQILIETERGQVCGYTFSKMDGCPTGVYDKYGQCVSDLQTKCPQGQIPILGPDGTSCVPEVNNCPFGFIMVGGKCQDLNRNNLCPVGQKLVETADGFECMYRYPAHAGPGTTKTECGSGQILSQAMRSFYCESHEVPSSEIILCEPELVFVKVGGGYACITEFEASLQCPGKYKLM